MAHLLDMLDSMEHEITEKLKREAEEKVQLVVNH
jgi:hypothetical protein